MPRRKVDTAKTLDEIIVFFGLSIIVVSGPRSKFSTVGGLSVPSFTVRLFPSGSVARLLTAVTYAFLLSKMSESRPLASGLQS